MISDMFDGYLRRLGVTDPGAPTAEGLFALQRAHLERIAYDNIDIQLGRPPGIDPELSVRRFAAGRGGYCFHLNGALALLLEALGYEVTRHIGGVNIDAASRTVNGGHLALTVRVDGTEYWVEAGLGDGPYEPLPLREGSYEQNGFRYALERLEPLAGEGPGWTFRSATGHAPRMNFRDAPAKTADFEEMHTWLSTSEESPSYGSSRCSGATRGAWTSCAARSWPASSTGTRRAGGSWPGPRSCSRSSGTSSGAGSTI